MTDREELEVDRQTIAKDIVKIEHWLINDRRDTRKGIGNVVVPYI